MGPTSAHDLFLLPGSCQPNGAEAWAEAVVGAVWGPGPVSVSVFVVAPPTGGK